VGREERVGSLFPLTLEPCFAVVSPAVARRQQLSEGMGATEW